MLQGFWPSGDKRNLPAFVSKAGTYYGADISEDGEFGEKTQKALKVFQADHGCGATGETDLATLNALGLNAEAKPLSQSTGNEPSSQKPILVTGGSVHIRTGPGTEFDSVMIAHAGDVLHGIDAEGWSPILLDGEVRWISQKYSSPQA